jgi:phage-related protein
MASLELIVKLAGGILTNLPKIAESAFLIVAKLIDGIGKYLDMVKNTGGKIIDRVKEGIAKLNPLTWGKDLISNFVKGIMSGIGAVGEAVGKVADKIRAFLHFSEPDEGPLADFSSYGPDLVDTFAKGIEDNAHKAAEAAEGLAGDIAMGFTSDINYNVPDIAGYAADLSASITGTGSTRIEVPVVIDGREIARASAWYMGEQLAWEAR